MAVVESDGGNQACRLSPSRNFFGFLSGDPHRLFDPERFACLDRGHRDLVVKEVGRTDRHNVDLRVTQNISVVLHSLFKSQVVNCELTVAFHNIAAHHQLDIDFNFRILLPQCFERPCVKTPHPSQRDHAYADSLPAHICSFALWSSHRPTVQLRLP